MCYLVVTQYDIYREIRIEKIRGRGYQCPHLKSQKDDLKLVKKWEIE